MKAFAKLQVSRQPFNNGDKDIDGYFFKLKEELTDAEKKELLDHVIETSKHVFTPGHAFGSAEVKFNNNNLNEKVKTMFLLTTLKTGSGVSAFTIDKIYGISKIRPMVTVDAIAIAKEPAAKKSDDLMKAGTGDAVKEKEVVDSSDKTGMNTDADKVDVDTNDSTEKEPAPVAKKPEAPKKPAKKVENVKKAGKKK